MTNLADYSLPQLKQLQTRITKEIEKRESDAKASLLKRLRKLAQEEGISLEDLLGRDQGTIAPAAKRGRPTAKSVSAKKEPLPAKYRNPNNLDQSWSGRGRKPGWFEAWVANGGSITALENAASMTKKGRRGVLAVPPLRPNRCPQRPQRRKHQSRANAPDCLPGSGKSVYSSEGPRPSQVLGDNPHVRQIRALPPRITAE